MNPATKPRRPGGLGALALKMLAVLIFGGVASALGAFLQNQPGAVGLAVTAAALMSVAMAAAFAVGVWWWRGIDEAAREAHKWAWWWGGSGGLAVGAVLLLILMVSADYEVLLPERFGSAPADLFVSGMMAILAFQFAGYALAWAGWWLKHR